MADELSKSAVAPGIMGRLWHSGLARGAGGAAIGGATGYGLGGGTGDPELDRAGRRAGAIRGALLGAAGGYAAPLVTREGRAKALQGAKDMYAGERHGLLGRGELRPASSRAGQMNAYFVEHGKDAPDLFSVPGIAKGIVQKPGATLRNAWNEGGPLGKAMAVGDLAMGARDVVSPDVPGGKAEKAGRLLGSSGGMLLGGKLPFLGGMLFSTATGAVGKHLGRAVDKITGSGQPPAAPPQAVL